MKLLHFDHIVLTTSHFPECLHFYKDILDMEVREENGRYSLHFGSCKINIHKRPGEFQPAAAYPLSGSIDHCLITDTPMEQVLSELQSKEAPLITGIVDRHGARGPMKSIYLRDPDGNLIEIARYVKQESAPVPFAANDEELADE